MCLLRQVYELWQHHPQFLGVVVDKMLKTQIVECCAVANWIFSRDMASEFTRSYTWEILHLTIRKMNKHVIRLEKELNDARSKLRAAPSDSESSDDDQNRGIHWTAYDIIDEFSKNWMILYRRFNLNSYGLGKTLKNFIRPCLNKLGKKKSLEYQLALIELQGSIKNLRNWLK